MAAAGSRTMTQLSLQELHSHDSVFSFSMTELRASPHKAAPQGQNFWRAAGPIICTMLFLNTLQHIIIKSVRQGAK